MHVSHSGHNGNRNASFIIEKPNYAKIAVHPCFSSAAGIDLMVATPPQSLTAPPSPCSLALWPCFCCVRHQVLWTLFADDKHIDECHILPAYNTADRLLFYRSCPTTTEPLREWAGPVLKEAVSRRLADWPEGTFNVHFKYIGAG